MQPIRYSSICAVSSQVHDGERDKQGTDFDDNMLLMAVVNGFVGHSRERQNVSGAWTHSLEWENKGSLLRRVDTTMRAGGRVGAKKALVFSCRGLPKQISASAARPPSTLYNPPDSSMLVVLPHAILSKYTTQLSRSACACDFFGTSTLKLTRYERIPADTRSREREMSQIHIHRATLCVLFTNRGEENLPKIVTIGS